MRDGARTHLTGPIIGFGLLGITVGHLGGLSDAAIVTAVISALFALIGGSLLTFFKDIAFGVDARVMAALSAICVGILIGIHSGIYVKLHAYQTERSGTTLTSILRTKLFKEGDVTITRNLVDNGQISKAEGYDRLMKFLEQTK